VGERGDAPAAGVLGQRAALRRRDRGANLVDAVAFDLDGVLIDSEADWDRARRTVVLSNGGHWNERASADLLGMSAPEWSQYVHDRLGVELEPQEIDRRVVELMLESLNGHVPLLPGAVDAVRRLAARWPLGLATSSNRPVIDTVLDAAGLKELFAATVSSEEVAAGKPAPDVYLAAAAKLGVDPGGSVAIEDSTNGIRSAHAAGMAVIVRPNRKFPPTPDALALASLVIESLDELTVEAVESVQRRRRQGS
jgi:HAD superfamily hydrolase (TIGR01509 family)